MVFLLVWAIKKAHSRDDTLADLIEVSMGTPLFRTSLFDMILKKSGK